jgi:uncharacterized protein
MSMSYHRTYLELADWRRRIAELYAEVRRIAELDPAAACHQWRIAREWLYRRHPQSPLPLEARSAFRALHFPYDPTLRFTLPVLPAGDAHVARGIDDIETDGECSGLDQVPSSRGDDLGVRPAGWIEVPFPEGARRLALFWLPDYAGGLLLAFGDRTNGHQTYGGGRYLLDSAKGADLGGDPAEGTIVVDFNFAYQPSCSFDPRWACPLPPPENRIDLAVLAGEYLAEASA